jgi:uncharacterized protein
MKRRAVIAATLFVVVCLWFGIAPAFFGLAHTKVVGSPKDYDIGFETVEFHPTDVPLTLRAWWMPADNAKAAIIMVHGGGDNRSHPYMQWLRLARALIDHGYAVMDLDLRNHGESDDSPGHRSTFGVDEATDVLAAMDYIAQRQPGTRFAGLGYSMGGQTVLYAAARDPRVEAVVSDGTYADVRDIVPNFAHAATGLPTALFSGPFVWSAQHLHDVPLDARAVDVIAHIGPRPVLLIHDAADPIVPVEECNRLARAYPAAQVWITSTPHDAAAQTGVHPPWGTHAKSYVLHPGEYVDRVSDFYDKVFARRAQ